MGTRQMDPDRFQMRDLKRRISKLEDQLGYMKTDAKLARLTVKLLNETVLTMVDEILRLEEWLASIPRPQVDPNTGP